MVALALQADGWWLRSDIIYSKKNPMPESVTDRPTRKHEYIFLLTKAKRYYYDAEAIKEKVTGNAHARGNGVNPKAAYKSPYGQGFTRRAKTPGKNSRIYQDRDPQHSPARKSRQNESFSAAVSGLVSLRNKRTVWTIATQSFSDCHFATFPQKLAEIPIRAGTSEIGACAECGSPWERVVEKVKPPLRTVKTNGPIGGHGLLGTNRFDEPIKTKTTGWQPTCTCNAETVPAVVFDPFGGSGTVKNVAERLGRKAIVIDRKFEYCQMAKKRCVSDQLKLFA